MIKFLYKLRNKHESIFRLFLFFFSLILILYLFPRQAKFKYEFTKGKPWLHETIIAPFDFSILKSESDLDKEKEIVKSQHLSLYNFNKNIFKCKS